MNVWEMEITKQEQVSYSKEYPIISSKLVSGRPLIHIYCPHNPGNGFREVEASLEDVFFCAVSSVHQEPELLQAV